MTTTTISITLAVAMALLLGRAAVVSAIRARRIQRLKAEKDRYDRAILTLEHSAPEGRTYYIDEGGILDRCYRVMLRVSGPFSRTPEVLVKEFPFGDDRKFALLEATELLEHLKEN